MGFKGYKTIVIYNGERYVLVSGLSESEFRFQKDFLPLRRYFIKKGDELFPVKIKDLEFVSQTIIGLTED